MNAEQRTQAVPRDEEVIYRVQQVEHALNALSDLARARGEDVEEADMATTPYGEFGKAPNGRYTFTWYA